MSITVSRAIHRDQVESYDALVKECNGNYSRFDDLVRVSITFDSPEDYRKYIKLFEKFNTMKDTK